MAVLLVILAFCTPNEKIVIIVVIIMIDKPAIAV